MSIYQAGILWKFYILLKYIKKCRFKTGYSLLRGGICYIKEILLMKK